MNRLYWKIFFSFTAAIILIVLVAVMLTSEMLKRGFSEQAVRSNLKLKLEQQWHDVPAKALAVYLQRGATGLDRWLLAKQSQKQVHLIFLDAQFRNVSSGRVPHVLRHKSRDAARHNAGQPPTPVWVILPVTREQGPPFHLLVLKRVQPNDLKALRQISIVVQIIVAIIMAAVVCLFLARRLTIPLQQLRILVQRFSVGELSVRSRDVADFSADEIGGLAGDFDSMAIQLEQLLGSQQRLMQDVSHELRSPLARLQVAAELARQQTPEAARPAFDRIELETQRLNGMIGQILSWSALTAGKTKINRQMLDLELELQTVIERETFGTNVEIALTNDLPAGLHIKADVSLLDQVLENILRNALKYGESTQVGCLLKAEAGYVVLRIDDAGPGVASEDLEHLFEPFYRSAKTRSSGGYGLGLAIAKRAMSIMDANISASNKQPNGLRVELRFKYSENVE